MLQQDWKDPGSNPGSRLPECDLLGTACDRVLDLLEGKATIGDRYLRVRCSLSHTAETTGWGSVTLCRAEATVLGFCMIADSDQFSQHSCIVSIGST